MHAPKPLLPNMVALPPLGIVCYHCGVSTYSQRQCEAVCAVLREKLPTASFTDPQVSVYTMYIHVLYMYFVTMTVYHAVFPKVECRQGLLVFVTLTVHAGLPSWPHHFYKAYKL